MLRYLRTALILAAIPGIAFANNVVTVVGADDPLVDRPALQAAVDAATPGTTLRLVGTFAFDGDRVLILTSDLTFEGEAVDDDGDGLTNEDWVDGVDNDGDGLTDEDDWNTVIRGVVDESGAPVLDDGVNGLFNRGLVVEGVTGIMERLQIRNIYFTGHHRAVDLTPEWGTPTGRCDDRVFTGGELRRVRLSGNRFDNSELGALGLGKLHSVRVNDNLFTNNGVGGFFIEGDEVGCPLAGDAGDVRLALGTPTFTSVYSNRFFDTGGFGTLSSRTHGTFFWENEAQGGSGGIGVLRDDGALVVGNRVSGPAVGITLLEAENVVALGNEVDDTFFGIEVAGSSRTLVWNNRVTGGFFGLTLTDSIERTTVFGNEVEDAFTGIVLEFGASGYKVFNNSISGSLLVDLSLDFDTSNNLVFNGGPTITAQDFGTGNRLLGNIEILP